MTQSELHQGDSCPHTLPETNSECAPENQWLEDEVPFGMSYFQGLCCFREGIFFGDGFKRVSNLLFSTPRFSARDDPI